MILKGVLLMSNEYLGENIVFPISQRIIENTSTENEFDLFFETSDNHLLSILILYVTENESKNSISDIINGKRMAFIRI